MAAEAIRKIRDWLGEETAKIGGKFTHRLAIKFCGGCNPVYERGEVAQKIREELPSYQWISWREDSDLVLIINGCPTACAERADVQKQSKAFLMIQPGNVCRIEKRIAQGFKE